MEDIVDSGLTLDYLLKTLRLRRPASMELASLLVKKDMQRVPVEVRYTGVHDRPRVRGRLRTRLRPGVPQPAVHRVLDQHSL